MRLLIDTNRYSEADRGDRDVIARLESSAELWVSVVVLGELRYGFALGNRQEENEENLREFLATPTVHVVPTDDETSHYYASVHTALKGIGKPIPTNDIWIAAQALQHNLTLYSADTHFGWVEGLRRV